MEQLKLKLKVLKEKIHQHRNLFGSLQPVLVLAALIFAGDIGFLPSVLLALSGLANLLAQITDEDEQKGLVVGNAILLSSFLVLHLFGTQMQGAVILLGMSLYVFTLRKKQ